MEEKAPEQPDVETAEDDAAGETETEEEPTAEKMRQANEQWTEELRQTRTRLLEMISGVDEVNSRKYAEKVFSFVSYLNGLYYQIPEFIPLAALSARLKEEKKSPQIVSERMEKERHRIFQKEINDEMRKLERALDPEEAKRIRQKITLGINSDMRMSGGKQPIPFEK